MFYSSENSITFLVFLHVDVGGGRTARRHWLGVGLAGRQRSAKCPKHSTEAHQRPRAQLGNDNNNNNDDVVIKD